ncbi:ABC transporter ATP-binding protein [Alkalibacter rhizosphaerae]|uniref:ABC-type quaternary amine transporter n=1 Tax=Alkalibacter rhizosphaerae TaxID=2815577 RepID=A0A975AJC1_9FIRM|nr:ABC transporter ATP-binding protein [Alkalibacter rhizosphaerae]QSX09445.1 ABC transporter ATP-binding protein [Alkalibacter rhizosphaerae]
MIDIKSVYKSYGEQPVLTGFDLSIEEGQLCMLLGPSGCGKSTLLKLINRLILPDSGSILVDGIPIENVAPEILRRNMGYAIQGAALFPHMRVAENIAVVPQLMNWSKEKTASRIQELLDLVGLPSSFAKKYPYQLSGGEAQRVGVARALAADPAILLLDEPFGALDPVSRLQLQKSFLEIQQKLKKTVVFVTHDVGEAVRMADFLVLLKDGKVVAKGHPFDIIREAENTIRDFLGNSYTLELLERITMEDLVRHATPMELDVHSSGLMTLSSESTCKELLSFMLMNGKNELLVKWNDQVLRFRFEDILASFGGGNR